MQQKYLILIPQCGKHIRGSYQLPLHEQQTKRNQTSNIAGSSSAMSDLHAQLKDNLSITLPELERKYDCSFTIT